ncbi:substrate-binding domain-containing protein [Luteolibacter arcticus]|uniref:Substrate-binding domain-containing protein n=1 Tax=Luteolibacter arcticus TaxID=1581411 RepID=A0ABT3GCY0_9BACT|nr:GntR family transcriptional regulator [Luteolibacter arcticus]MCW1921472.1 substrate-binding domain-containing protein [Luteolibacter arcticus]
MESLRRITLADQTEAALREAIRDGRFGERLPGFRPLAKALSVNPVTVAEAVARLVEDGTLLSDGPRKKFRIPQAGRGAKQTARRKVLYLTAEPLHEMRTVALEILSQLLLERPEWDVRHRTTGHGNDARPDRRRWDGLLKSEEARHLVVFGGRPDIAKWSLDRGVPAYFLGGDTGRLAVPMLGVNAADMLSQVMGKLMDLGHSRICQLMCGLPEGFCQRQRNSMAECLEERGLPFVPNYHAPIIPRSDPEDLAAALARVIKVRPPTALVLFDWEHFIIASCVLRDHGLRIPKDISIAMLSQDRMMEWHLPRIAHFKYPVVQVARTLTKWIETPPENLHMHVSLPLELMEAESLARAPES